MISSFSVYKVSCELHKQSCRKFILQAIYVQNSNWHHPDRRDTKQLCHDSWLPVTLFGMLWSHVSARLPIIGTFMRNDHDIGLHDTPARYYVSMSHRDPSNSCSTTVLWIVKTNLGQPLCSLTVFEYITTMAQMSSWALVPYSQDEPLTSGLLPIW